MAITDERLKSVCGRVALASLVPIINFVVPVRSLIFRSSKVANSGAKAIFGVAECKQWLESSVGAIHELPLLMISYINSITPPILRIIVNSGLLISSSCIGVV